MMIKGKDRNHHHFHHHHSYFSEGNQAVRTTGRSDISSSRRLTRGFEKLVQIFISPLDVVFHEMLL